MQACWSYSLQPLLHSNKKKYNRKNVPACWWLLFWFFAIPFFVGFGLSSPKKRLQCFDCFWTFVEKLDNCSKPETKMFCLRKITTKEKAWKKEKSDICCCFWSLGRNSFVCFVTWHFYYWGEHFFRKFAKKTVVWGPQNPIFSLNILTVISFRLLA